MSKTIVLRCDSTGQRFEANKANPLRFHYCLENGPPQSSFHDPGVGTFDPEDGGHTDGWIADIAALISENIRGLGFGHGAIHNIKDAYRYLMSVYEMAPFAGWLRRRNVTAWRSIRTGSRNS